MKSHARQRHNEFTDALEVALRRYHPALLEAGVTFDVLTLSEIDDATGEEFPCLKHQGYGAAATIKIVGTAERALGQADARLTICAVWWRTHSGDERLALIDHELTHLQLVRREGQVVRDDQKRPKLRMRLHDYQIGGFREVVQRHGADAQEVIQVRACRDEATGQYAWDFDADAVSTARIAAKINEMAPSNVTSVTFTKSDFEVLGKAARKMRGESQAAE